MLVTAVIKFLLNNIKTIVVGLVILFFLLFINQCKKTNDLKNQLTVVKSISEQNVAALTDKSINLKVTTEQLSKIDTQLYIAKNKLDSLTKSKSTQIGIGKIEYKDRPVYIPTGISVDSLNKIYTLTFRLNDSVKSFNGASNFKLKYEKGGFVVIPDNTEINNFKFNFELVFSQYTDPITKYTKTNITPFYVNGNGDLISPISKNNLNIMYRNAEILDKPYTDVKPVSKNKIQMESGWTFTFNPIAFGCVVSHGIITFGYTPNIGFGYYFAFKRIR